MKLKLLGVSLLFLGLAAAAFATPEHAACVQRCQEAFKECQEVERETHVLRVQACDGSRECLRAEQERHQAAQRACVQLMQDCKRSCRD